MRYNIYEYTECDEIADNIPTPGRIATFDEALQIVKEKMPGESAIIQSNVAYALMLKSRGY